MDRGDFVVLSFAAFMIAAGLSLVAVTGWRNIGPGYWTHVTEQCRKRTNAESPYDSVYYYVGNFPDGRRWSMDWRRDGLLRYREARADCDYSAEWHWR